MDNKMIGICVMCERKHEYIICKCCAIDNHYDECPSNRFNEYHKYSICDTRYCKVCIKFWSIDEDEDEVEDGAESLIKCTDCNIHFCRNCLCMTPDPKCIVCTKKKEDKYKKQFQGFRIFKIDFIENKISKLFNTYVKPFMYDELKN